MMHGPDDTDHSWPRAATPPSEIQRYPYLPPDDEISLVDLWLILARHKRIIIGVVLVALLAGAAAALLLPKTYKYSTSIEIGTTVVDRGQGVETVLVDEPQTVLAKLETSYIPLVLDEYSKKNPQSAGSYKITASIPKGSQIVTLSAKGKTADGPVYKRLMTEATDRIIKDHKRLMDINRGRLEAQLVKEKIALDALTDPAAMDEKKKELETKVTQARLHLEELKDPRVLAVSKNALEAEVTAHKDALSGLKDKANILKHRYSRLDRLEQLLKKQTEQLESEIKAALSRRQTASGSVSDAPAAMTMLMVDNEIQQNRDRLAHLEERLYVDLKNQRDELDASVAENQRAQGQEKQLIAQAQGALQKLILDNEREQKEQQPKVDKLEASLKKLDSDHQRDVVAQRQKIHEMETRLKNMKETQAIAPPMRSPRPSGAGAAVIIALSLVLGLMLGVFAAFFAEFLGRVREASQRGA